MKQTGKKRVDILLYKSLEFRNKVGQKVIVTDIPVLRKDSPYNFVVQVRLQKFLETIFDVSTRSKYSFKDYLRGTLKWPVYEQIFKTSELKNNA